MKIKNNMKRAVCVVLRNDHNQFLSVSRKDNILDRGFPGGKVDEGETLLEAIKRETFEETGLIISNVQEVHEGFDEHDYLVTCFSADFSGEIKTSEIGVVEWVAKEILTSIDTSSFAGYNSIIFQKL